MKRLVLGGLSALLLVAMHPADATAARYVIEINDMKFGAAPPNLKVGDTIEWQNKDIFRHTATARTGGFDLDLPPGAHAQVTFKKAEKVTVYCRYHPNMIIVLQIH
jgi:plastocyanin